jgi:Trypsin-like peptidase domain
MKVDWQRKASSESVGESASVLLGSRRGRGLESGLESMTPRGPTETERLDRLSEALATSKPAVPEGEQAAIKDEVLAGARTGLAKMNQGEPPQNFTLGEHIGLEAVILTNGERPSLFVRNGFVDLGSPDIGEWGLGLNRFQNAIRKVIASVGRVDVPVRPWFAGTCFVVAEGLVVTNRHVLEAIATQDAAGAWTLNWPDATSVDFVGEDGAATATKFKVTGVAFAGPDPIQGTINFAHLDMAILRVDPASDAANPFPGPVTFETDTAQPKARRDLYVLGFPGEPRIWTFDGTPPAGNETMQVISTLFNDKFGVKRLAPGSVKSGAGEVADDAKKWICTHDASTLGGNSGSCVADLGGDGFRVMALHFAGANRAQNWAHVAARLHDQLAQFSATFVA